MGRLPLASFALGCLAGTALLPSRQIPSPPSPGPGTQEGEEGLTPRERLRRKMERDLEGVWQVERLSSPSFPYVQGVQGYFLFYREYVAYTVTATMRASLLTGLEEGFFQSG